MASEEQILINYLRRSYQAVDGLWFMMVEQATGFDQALEIDRQVWAVLAKIQARKARELAGCTGNTPAELSRCFGLKLTADGHRFESAASCNEARFIIHECPWLQLLRKSERRDLAARISQTICPTEGGVWSAEFGGEYEFHMPLMACAGADHCEMRFARKAED